MCLGKDMLAERDSSLASERPAGCVMARRSGVCVLGYEISSRLVTVTTPSPEKEYSG